MAKTIPVLVVDDDAVSSAQLCALAKAAGYTPTAAANGREAWEMLQLSRIVVHHEHGNRLSHGPLRPPPDRVASRPVTRSARGRRSEERRVGKECRSR